MTATKRPTKKSLIEKIHSYPENSTLDVNGLSMKELREIVKLSEAGIFDTTEVTGEEIEAALSGKPAKAQAEPTTESAEESTEEPVDEPVVDTSLSDTAARLNQAVSAIIAEEKQDLADSRAEKLFGTDAAAALAKATALQAAHKPLELTPSGLYVKMVIVTKIAYVTADGSWVAVKDEKGASEKKPWTLYAVDHGTLRQVGFYRSSEQAFDPKGAVSISLQSAAA